MAWESLFRGLVRIGFDGDTVIESFVHMHPDLARALSIWRPVAAGGTAEVIRRGVPFLHDCARRHGFAMPG